MNNIISIPRLERKLKKAVDSTLTKIDIIASLLHIFPLPCILTDKNSNIIGSNRLFENILKADVKIEEIDISCIIRKKLECQFDFIENNHFFRVFCDSYQNTKNVDIGNICVFIDIQEEVSLRKKINLTHSKLKIQHIELQKSALLSASTLEMLAIDIQNENYRNTK